jgi:pPIWI_RE three-gene island domain Y
MTAITRHCEHGALPCAGLGAGHGTREQSHGFVSGVVYRCVVSRTQTVDPHARDSAVVACCLAASAVSDAALSDRQKAAILMDCLGVLAAISPPGQVMTFGQLRAGLTMPLRELLPATIDPGSTGDVVLLDAEGMLSPEAEDVCHEHFIGYAALDQHWSQARVRAEQEEQRLYLALRDLGAEGYTRARELLTDNPAGDLRTSGCPAKSFGWS